MIKHIREMSDLHGEFSPLVIPPLPTDKETILLLAGDIHVKAGIFKNGWLKDVSEQFAHVAYILGNHEHYTSSIDITAPKIKQGFIDHQITNVSLLDNKSLIILGTNVKLIGGTMW